jgi:hypothetical protein
MQEEVHPNRLVGQRKFTPNGLSVSCRTRRMA